MPPPRLPYHPELVASLRALFQTLASAALEPFLADWPPHDAGVRPVTAVTLPALQWLPLIQAQAPPAAARVTQALVSGAPSLHWRQSYPAERVGRLFLENYAWTELLGSSGEVPSSRLAGGFLVLGPHTSYPGHAHQAEEIYVPLSGTAHWWKASAGWQAVAPVTVVHHAPNEAHAMRTADQPLLALYLWHGPGLEGKAHLVGDPVRG
ncbi:MAG TPA: dimethylsulfonioproprionate lyase family protein [Steroidobacteraceae bacterium]|jgi:hypothetical protein|nr:dimethylsulfonioproprionate lyase family protein [Steroidobacteraceae bacterium]